MIIAASPTEDQSRELRADDAAKTPNDHDSGVELARKGGQDDSLAHRHDQRAGQTLDLIALTTPFGKRGWFYDQWRNGEGYQRTKKTALDCPRITAAFLNKERLRLGPLMFRQEYMCEFIDPGASAFSSELIDACPDDSFGKFP